MAVAEARYAALQAERGYVEQLWSPRQWDAICDAFEADFTFLSHTDLSAVFRIRRHIQGRCVEVSVPVGLCLQATLRLESFLLDHPAAAAASVRKFLRDATLVGDDRCPAVRYRRQCYLLPPALVRPGLDPLFAAVAASPPVRDSLLSVPCFRVLWQALQTQCQRPLPTSSFRLHLRAQSCLVRPSCALDAALALAPLQALSSDADVSALWHAFCLLWDVSSSLSGHLFHPSCHSYASAPAAAAPRIYEGDASPALAPPSPPEPSAPYLCRFCSLSFSDEALFDDHLHRAHACSLTAYPSLLRTALGHSFPRAADPFVLRHILSRFHSAAQAAWSAPPLICACCATTPSQPPYPSAYNLRTAAFDLPSLHDFLSARGYVQRYRARLPAALPDSFVGLTFADLANHSVPAPLAHSCDDRWLLFLADPSARAAWLTACHDSTLPLSVPLCLTCAASLQGPRASLPGRALANDNVHVPLPPHLRDLTPAEILFVSRGFTVSRLITLPCRGPPEARQLALLGNVISFPQNSATLVHLLPRPVATVAEHLTVFFPADDASTLRHAPEFVVRRARVHSVILWLQAHNPFYADVLVDEAALAALPQHGIPSPVLAAARPLPATSIGAEPGPAEATSAPPAAAAAPHSLSAAVLDVEGEATHPLALWQRCLLAVDDACQTLSTAPADAVLAAASADRVASAAGALLDAPAPAPAAPPDTAPDTTCFIVPHGSAPLSAFDESYWTLCFPHLFPFGEATERSPRVIRIQDRLWFRSLLLRADRASDAFPWRLDPSFAAVSFAVLHRRALMRAVRAKLSAPGFRRTLSDLQSLRAVDFRRVFDVVGAHGGIPQALRHNQVTAAMKNLLGALRLVTGSVPCTDAARSVMRHEITALQIFFGLPTFFLTFNPCDTRHPFTAALRHPDSNTLSLLPLPAADDALFAALQHLDLPMLVARDPVAATQAFHLHVSLFLAELLGCPCSTAPPSTPRTVEGIFGHVDAFYGVTEPQNRGSLHLHILVHLSSFTSPQRLIERFRSCLPLLSERLLQWAASMQHTSLEALPPAFLTPAATETLRCLQPLPFSRAHRHALGPSMEPFLAAASHHWFPADPPRRMYVDCSDPASCFDPFSDLAAARPPTLPWPRQYLGFASAASSRDWMASLLYDARHTIVQCGLHECRPATCWKGWLGRIHFCRLGFWHWEPCPPTPRTWRRMHGHALQPSCVIGHIPPSRGLLLPERHHPFFGKTNAAILLATKSNHDVSILLRAPPADTPLDEATYLQFMLTSMRTTTFYVTSYSSKVQPQLTNLWSLLMSGQASLEAELESRAEPLPALAHASRVLHRMISACQKRVHKSMPEMLQFLLGFPEAYTSHAFQRLFLADLLPHAEAFLANPSEASALPAPVLLVPPPAATPGAAVAVRLVPQHLDYVHRTTTLASWPLYFYVAGVRRCSRTQIASASHVVPFHASHPLSSSHAQKVLLTEPWAVPLLSGARLPDPVADPERFALLALLLLKPWSDATLCDLLAPTVPGPRLTHWSEGLLAFESSLHAALAAAPAASTDRARPFSPLYWAQRSIDVLLHLRNITSGHFLDPNTAAVRSNPDAAAGHSGSVELPQPAPGDAPPSSCSDDDIDVASVDGVAFDEPDPLPAVPSASASISFLTWQDIHDACHGFASAADGYCAHFRSHAAFTFPSPSPPPCQPIASPTLPVTALLQAEADWASAVASSALPPSAASPSSSSRCPSFASPLDTVTAWLHRGRCNKPDGHLNLQQAAMLCLHALWLRDVLLHRRSLLATPPPTQSSILLGGPGTGKSYVLHMLHELNALYLPEATKICALMHTAARLIHGRTLHSALSIPFEPLHAKNKSLGDKKKRSFWPTGRRFDLSCSTKFPPFLLKSSVSPNSAAVKSKTHLLCPGAVSAFMPVGISSNFHLSKRLA